MATDDALCVGDLNKRAQSSVEGRVLDLATMTRLCSATIRLGRATGSTKQAVERRNDPFSLTSVAVGAANHRTYRRYFIGICDQAVGCVTLQARCEGSSPVALGAFPHGRGADRERRYAVLAQCKSICETCQTVSWVLLRWFSRLAWASYSRMCNGTLRARSATTQHSATVRTPFS